MSPASTPARNRRLPRAAPFAAVVLFVAIVLLVIAIAEGDLPADLIGVRNLARTMLRHYGAGGALALLYIEESGIPLPVPGDVYVAYLGRLAAGDVLRWLGAFFGIITVVTAGSTNLYWVSRRIGIRLVEHRLAAAFHLDRRRIAEAEGRFARWGVLAVIFGRHIPGLRVPITVAAGLSRFPYPLFAGSVAISSAGWAAIWLYLGARYGPALGRFFEGHAWTYLVFVLLVIALIAIALVRAWRVPPTKTES